MKTFLAAALLAAVSAVPASAAILHWTINDATFDDGTSLTGSFDVDTDSNAASNWSLVTQDGALTGFSYAPSNSAFIAHFFGPQSYIFSRTDAPRYISLDFASVLTTAGTVAMTTGNLTDYECDNCSPYRVITAGYVSSGADEVPEPAMLGLFGLGAIGLGLARRRRRV